MRAAIRFASFISLLLVSMQSWADYQLNLTPGVTRISEDQYAIHTTVMWICVGIGVVVFGAMIYSMIMHRKSRGAVSAGFEENLKVEIVWTIIPFLILGFMAVPATKILLDAENTSKPDMSIKVTGYQWKWKYDYLDQLGKGISFFSNMSTSQEEIDNKATKTKHYLREVDHKLVVPVGKRIRLLITANDVIHSWYVPDLGIKQDAIPGYINTTWFKTDKVGVYRGQCAELCGAGHGFMPIVVDVRSAANYAAWVNQQKQSALAAKASSNKVWTKAELMTHGKKIYATCAACHQANGKGIPGVFPALDGSKVATGDVKKHIKKVLFGVKGTAMQAFGAQMDDADLAAVITYERNSWSNHTGDIVQPVDIKAER